MHAHHTNKENTNPEKKIGLKKVVGEGGDAVFQPIPAQVHLEIGKKTNMQTKREGMKGNQRDQSKQNIVQRIAFPTEAG